MNELEIIGFITGIICVWLNAKQSLWSWPIAMISVLTYAYVFFNSKLYADACLQIFFFIISIYGLYKWWKKDEKNEHLKPTYSSKYQIIFSTILILFISGILTGVLDKFTDSDTPLADAITTSLSIVAQVLLGKKKILNWIYWIVADIIYVGLYLYKELYLTAILYMIFIGLAAWGYYIWQKQIIRTST
jgi:nicotinamide mononucleotide transporter